MTVTAEQAQPGRRYKTPRGSTCTVDTVPAEGQVLLKMEQGGNVSVPRAYPLTPLDPPAEGGTDLALVIGKARSVVEASLAGLTLAELDDLADRDPRMLVLELVDIERARRTTAAAGGTDHDQPPVPDRDDDDQASAQATVEPEPEAAAPASACCPVCSTEQPLQASSKSPGTMVFRPHASPQAAYCPGSAKAWTPPAPAAVALQPAGPFSTGPGLEAVDADSRIRVVQRMTTLEQVAAARAHPGVQASVVRELDRQQSALQWVLEADGDMPALQARAGAHRLENRPGALAVVREMIARLRGLGVDPEPSVVAKPRGDHPDTVVATSDYVGEHAGLARRLHVLTGLEVWTWADLEAVAAMTGTVRASRAALRATGDRALVQAAWLIERTADNRETVLGQLASRYTSLGGKADELMLPDESHLQDEPEAAADLEGADTDGDDLPREHDPEDSEAYWHGVADYGDDLPRDQWPTDYDEQRATEWCSGWDHAQALARIRELLTERLSGRYGQATQVVLEATSDFMDGAGRRQWPIVEVLAKLERMPGAERLLFLAWLEGNQDHAMERGEYAPKVAAVEQVDPPKVLPLADAEPARDPFTNPRPHDVVKFTDLDGRIELWVVEGYSLDQNALRGDGHLGVLVLTEHEDHPAMDRGAYRRGGFMSWWAGVMAEPGTEFAACSSVEVVQVAVPGKTLGGTWCPPDDGFDYTLEPGATSRMGHPRPPDELLPAPWREHQPKADEVPPEAEIEPEQATDRIAVVATWAEHGSLYAGDGLVVGEFDDKGALVREWAADLVNTDDRGALLLSWPDGRRAKHRRFSARTGIAIGDGGAGGSQKRIVGVLERKAVAALAELAEQEHQQVQAAIVGAEPGPEVSPVDDLSLPFAEQVTRASLGRVRELLADNQADAHLVHQALVAERAAGARPEVLAAIGTRLDTLREQLDNGPFADQVAHLDTGEAVALVADNTALYNVDTFDVHAGKREVQAALALEAQVHNRDAVLQALTASLVQLTMLADRTPDPGQDDPGPEAAPEAVPEAQASPPVPPAPPGRARLVDAQAARAAAAEGKIALRLTDLRVFEQTVGEAELWAFPDGKLPQRLGPVSAPALAPYVAAVRQQDDDGAPVVPWRPASRRTPKADVTPAATPGTPLGALGEALGALQAMGLRVDIRITSDDRKD